MHENEHSGSRADPADERTDRHDEAKCRFSYFANVPTN